MISRDLINLFNLVIIVSFLSSLHNSTDITLISTCSRNKRSSYFIFLLFKNDLIIPEHYDGAENTGRVCHYMFGDHDLHVKGFINRLYISDVLLGTTILQ